MFVGLTMRNGSPVNVNVNQIIRYYVTGDHVTIECGISGPEKRNAFNVEESYQTVTERINNALTPTR